MIDERKLRESIWQGIRKEVSADRICFYLPFYYGAESDEPLCLTWDRNGTLSDGGRAISELKKRMGNIEPCLNTIHRVLARCGGCKLVGGQVIVKEHVSECCEQNMGFVRSMNLMLKAMTLISMMDTAVVTEDAEVIV